MDISTKNNLPKEEKMRVLVENLCKRYEIPLFTQEILIERGAIPHSHPVLTLNTRTFDELSVLKTLVHEQFHWYAQDHSRYTECIEHLKNQYADDGEHNKSGTYPDSHWEHIIVCFNTRNHLLKILKADEVKWIYEQWQAYPILEVLIEQRFDEVKDQLKTFDLIHAS